MFITVKLNSIKILFLGETLTKDIFTSNRVSENYEPLPLENLNLGNNKIAFLKHDFFVHISDLKSLDLSNNPIDILELKKAFVHLKKLQVIQNLINIIKNFAITSNNENE